MYIDIFRPASYERKPLNIDYLNSLTARSFMYASKGRNALEHIFKSFNYGQKVLLSPYMCSSVLKPLRRLKLAYDFFDVDERDLNPDIDSIVEVQKKTNAKAIVIASMYGNPANLVEIERYCQENEVLLIDDAAQSFGSKLENRYVGTFGSAGFFSFSPGKPTAGHMGAFFWTQNDHYNFQRTVHNLVHRISYLNYYLNRYEIYNNRYKFITSKLRYIERVINTFVSITNDDISGFEKEILGGILDAVLSDSFNYRQYYFDIFVKKFCSCKDFGIIQAVRGEPRNHKIVLKCKNQATRDRLIKHLNAFGVFTYTGYGLLTNDTSNLNISKEIATRIIELPIEDDEEKMLYLNKVLEAGVFN